ncbi:MAG: response regulator [Candidatus Andersenbacteria bacterium]
MPPDKRRLRVVCADDEEDIRDLLCHLLRAAGYEVVGAATNGHDLIAQALETDPDVVVTDIMMPDMNGLEAAHQIYEHKPLPIIILSGRGDEEMIKQGVATQAMGYLVKPIRLEQLQAVMAYAVARFEQLQQSQQESAEARQALTERKIIERAKGLIMKKAGLDEATAYQRLHTAARKRQVKVAALAAEIIAGFEALWPNGA